MLQWICVDRRVRLAYLALAAAGCRAAPGPLVPVGAVPVDAAQVATWVGATVPTDHRLHRFKWLFRDERSSAGGRGSARIAPPDSLRFDVAGPFGSEPAAAVVIGDQALWTEPPDAVRKLVPNFPLMWAMLGVARLPEGDAALRGLQRGELTVWQYAGPTDTLEYVRRADRLIAEVRQGGKVLGHAETTLGPDGLPLASRLDVPGVPARLDLTFLSTSRADFAPDVWVARKP